mmetsp:Transcript_26665/g.69299  ORF Transcript_26665/g.69299 Transcript_26665/m.69299 type:complete len:256 (-) Transcript_26665:130-897(-)
MASATSIRVHCLSKAGTCATSVASRQSTANKNFGRAFFSPVSACRNFHSSSRSDDASESPGADITRFSALPSSASGRSSVSTKARVASLASARYFSSAGVPRAACASSSSKSYTITSLAASSSPACFSASVSFEASSVSSTRAASATSRASAASTSGATGGGPYGLSSQSTGWSNLGNSTQRKARSAIARSSSWQCGARSHFSRSFKAARCSPMRFNARSSSQSSRSSRIDPWSPPKPSRKTSARNKWSCGAYRL